jgi:hypothetical protein
LGLDNVRSSPLLDERTRMIKRILTHAVVIVLAALMLAILARLLIG